MLTAVPGIFAVCLSLSSTRWGSYIGLSPLFLSDVLIALAVFHFTIAWLAGNTHPLRKRGSGAALWTIWSILALVIIRTLVGDRLSLTTLRDLAPYAYSSLALVAGVSINRVTGLAHARTATLLAWALNFHAMWFIAATFLPLPSVMVAPNVALFSLRDDVDAAVAGVAAALIIVKLIRGETGRPVLHVAFLLAIFGAISFGPSRAGLSSAILVCAVALYLGYNSIGGSKNRQRIMLALGAPVGALAILLFMQSPVSVRLLAIFDPTMSGDLAQGARGTARARQSSWVVLSSWILNDPIRTWFGVGFGPDFLADSKANLVLLGTQADSSALGAPRSPHNYWLGTLARLGLIGLSLIISAIVGGTVRFFKFLRHAANHRLLLTSGLVVLGMLPIATLGVVLESPFGAIPFWWSLGIVLAWPRNDSEAGESGLCGSPA